MAPQIINDRLQLLSECTLDEISNYISGEEINQWWRLFLASAGDAAIETQVVRVSRLRTDVLRLTAALAGRMPRSDSPKPEVVISVSAQGREFAQRAVNGDHFGDFVLPFVEVVATTLIHELARLQLGFGQPKISLRAIEDMVADVAQKLMTQCRRTLILELNVARECGSLRGGTSEERFDDFRRMLSGDAFRRDVFGRYPLLKITCQQIADLAVKSCLTFADHLVDDWDDLAEIVGSDVVEVNRYQPGAGDPHRGGTSTAIVEFNFQDGFRRVVYKPRSLTPEALLQAVMRIFDADASEETQLFRTPRTLERSDHGWVEYVTRAPPIGSVQPFFRRLGALAALSNLLQLVDLHMENIIAAGDWPVVVDAETLAHPVINSADAKIRIVSESLLGTMIFPSFFSRAENGDPITPLSALTDIWEQTPFEGATVIGHGTDHAYVSVERITLPPEAFGSMPPLPTVDTSVGNVMERHGADLKEGMCELLRRLPLVKNEIISLLVGQNRCILRVVFRPTALYTVLLENSRHPHSLIDMGRRFLNWEKLWSPVSGPVPPISMLIDSEQTQLERNDVPYFWVDFRSRWVKGADGEDVYELPRSPLEELCDRVERATTVDIVGLRRRNSWLIDTVGASTHISTERRASTDLVVMEPEARRTLLLQRGRVLLDEVLALRVDTRPGGPGWLTRSGDATQDTWYFHEIGPHLYDGEIGIAILLFVAGELYGDESLASLAQSLYSSAELRIRFEARKAKNIPLGGLVGLGGYLFASGIFARRLGVGFFADRAAYVAEILDFHLNPEVTDFLGGAAGLALVSSRLASNFPDSAHCLNRIIERSVATVLESQKWIELGGERVPVWCADPPEPPFGGFAHGAAGYAATLASASSVLSSIDLSEIANKAWLYQDSLWDFNRSTWRDPREGPVPHDPMREYCHGAAGVGVAALIDLESTGSVASKLRLELATKAVLREGIPANDSICHGLLGNLMFLERAAAHLPELAPAIEGFNEAQIEDLCQRRTICGSVGAVRTPGLFTGVASLAYGMLRLARPDLVPDVLCLKLPDPVRKAGT